MTTAPRDPATRLWSQDTAPPPPAWQVAGQLAISDAACLRPDCDWTFTGPADDVEREARRHSGELAGGPGHPTITGRMKS